MNLMSLTMAARMVLDTHTRQAERRAGMNKGPGTIRSAHRANGHEQMIGLILAPTDPRVRELAEGARARLEAHSDLVMPWVLDRPTQWPDTALYQQDLHGLATVVVDLRLLNGVLWIQLGWVDRQPNEGPSRSLETVATIPLFDPSARHASDALVRFDPARFDHATRLIAGVVLTAADRLLELRAAEDPRLGVERRLHESVVAVIAPTRSLLDRDLAEPPAQPAMGMSMSARWSDLKHELKQGYQQGKAGAEQKRAEQEARTKALEEDPCPAWDDVHWSTSGLKRPAA